MGGFLLSRNEKCTADQTMFSLTKGMKISNPVHRPVEVIHTVKKDIYLKRGTHKIMFEGK